MSPWYLLRTKTGGERIAEQQLSRFVEGTLLPLAKTRLRQQGRVFERVAPLFPCYLFASFDLPSSARRIRYTPGVREIVQFGDQAAVVPEWVVDLVTLRCGNGPVALLKDNLQHGAAVKLVGGPFHDFGAIFDGYLDGAERVAVLLSVMNGVRRVVMPSGMVVAAA